MNIVAHLLQQTHAYSFQQAVRLLERAALFHNGKNKSNHSLADRPVATFIPPEAEAIRFTSTQALKFPAADLASIKKRKTSSGEQWQVSGNFMGLTGVAGVLPYHYTETILQRLKLKDEAMLHFLNLFNHRTISLFYQAASKYNLPIEYERSRLFSLKAKDTDTGTHALKSLIGLGTNGLQERASLKAESLIYYSGLFTQQVRTSTGLQQILQHQFNIPIDIHEFVSQRQELIDDVRTRLGSRFNTKGQNACLGRSAILGSHGWFAQGKIRVALGPLTKDDLSRFRPGTDTLKCLNELVRLYVGLEIDYDFVLRIKRSDIPRQIELGKKEPPIMGWNTWLSSKDSVNSSKSETVDIVVSANRLR